MADPTVALRIILDEAETLVTLVGAGLSAESGISTFRGPGGLWRNYSPEKLATAEAFERDPRLVWEWYDWRRGIIHKAQPNRGHRALAELERKKAAQGRQKGSFTQITQNVDGLDERAGSRDVVKLHGDIWLTRCMGCRAAERNEEVPLANLPPLCRCGALLRPGVVWFGEPMPAAEWQRAREASVRAQVFVVVGTSAVVYPAAGLAEVAREAGSKIVVVNPEPTPLDAMADYVLRGRAGEILPRLL